MTGRSDTNLNWSRFGLSSGTPESEHSTTNGFVDLSSNYGVGGHHASGANELFAEEQGNLPWWKSNFFISQRVLFGTWDGVFTSCLINIFGVIVFLRSGWIVAEAGIVGAVLIVLATVFIALISVLSAVGICERCRIESGGVYFLVAHVLGSKLGGSLGILYCFGQAVGCALNVLGFGESVAGLIGYNDYKWVVRGIAGTVVLLLSIINVAGVKWVIKLQFILLVVLLLAALDFMVGSFVHTDISVGFEGWFNGNFIENLWSKYDENYTWFSVFGVFFPTITGILAGINMSGDLRSPSTNIPNGTLSAIAAGTFFYLVFVVFLGATCIRPTLATDFMITAKVSAIQLLLLGGLYVSSISSCLGAMYGTPRVLQSIAVEGVVPGLAVLGTGRGPNKVPIYALGVVAIITLTFILIGEINTLAPIVTMPYLLTYACIDYSYFALAQIFDMHTQREQRFHRPTRQVQSSEDEDDLNILFPERVRHKSLTSDSSPEGPTSPSTDSNKQHVHSKRKNWYSNLCNRWLSLFGVFSKLIIMICVNWLYASICLVGVFVIWCYIGTTNPAVQPGVASEFRFYNWLKSLLLRFMGKKVYDYEQIVITPVHAEVQMTSSQINEENEDFLNRKRYHHSSTVHGHTLLIDN